MKMSKETEAMSLTDMVTYIKTNQAGIDKDVDNRIMEILFKIGYIIGKKNGKFRGFKNVYGPDHEENTLNDFCVYLMMKLYSFLCKNGPSSITNIYYYINGYFEIYANNFLGGFFYSDFSRIEEFNTGTCTPCSVGQWYFDQNRDFTRVEADVSFIGLNRALKSIVNKVPVKDEVERKNIFISAMLTILNILHFDYPTIEKIRKKDNFWCWGKTCTRRIYNYRYKKKFEKAILYHLDENMSGLIVLLARRAMKQIIEDISYSNGMDSVDFYSYSADVNLFHSNYEEKDDDYY